MTLAREVLSSLVGAWRMVRRDEHGMHWFNLSEAGFWRSFVAAALALPLYLPFSVIEARLADAELRRHLVWDLGGYAASWIAAPVVLLGLAVLLQRTRRFAAMVIASNWVAVPEFAIFAVAHLLALAIPPIAMFVIVAAFAWVMAIEYFVARTAFEISPAPAVGVVVVTLLVSLLINSFTAPPA